jgi:hypothetical protein
MQQTKDMLEFTKDLPGMEGKQDKIDQALHRVGNAAKNTKMGAGNNPMGVQLKDNPTDMSRGTREH